MLAGKNLEIAGALIGPTIRKPTDYFLAKIPDQWLTLSSTEDRFILSPQSAFL
jgi:hypothetical protein